MIPRGAGVTSGIGYAATPTGGHTPRIATSGTTPTRGHTRRTIPAAARQTFISSKHSGSTSVSGGRSKSRRSQMWMNPSSPGRRSSHGGMI
nr:MAG TPA: hypothetical protein [Caudoviricetes sp.]